MKGRQGQQWLQLGQVHMHLHRLIDGKSNDNGNGGNSNTDCSNETATVMAPTTCKQFADPAPAPHQSSPARSLAASDRLSLSTRYGPRLRHSALRFSSLILNFICLSGQRARAAPKLPVSVCRCLCCCCCCRCCCCCCCCCWCSVVLT